MKQHQNLFFPHRNFYLIARLCLAGIILPPRRARRRAPRCRMFPARSAAAAPCPALPRRRMLGGVDSGFAHRWTKSVQPSGGAVGAHHIAPEMMMVAAASIPGGRLFFFFPRPLPRRLGLFPGGALSRMSFRWLLPPPPPRAFRCCDPSVPRCCGASWRAGRRPADGRSGLQEGRRNQWWSVFRSVTLIHREHVALLRRIWQWAPHIRPYASSALFCRPQSKDRGKRLTAIKAMISPIHWFLSSWPSTTTPAPAYR